MLKAEQEDTPMKKLISIILCLVLVSSLFAGCTGQDLSNLSGKERAKLMLANTRLDSDDLDISLTGGANNVRAGQEEFRLDLLSTAVSGNTVTWEDFTLECNAYDFFESYFVNIEHEAQRFAQIIDQVKSTCNITDYWLKDDFSDEAVMLTVEANAEVVYLRNELGYSVCRRYTDANARDVYEMYRAENNVRTRMLYIPGNRYEFTLGIGNDYLYIVAENDRGYWNMFQTSIFDTHANIMNLVNTGDISFNLSTDISPNQPEPSYNIMNFCTPDLSCDIISFCGDVLTLNLAAYHGVSRVESTKDNVELLDGETNLLVTGIGTLVTANGTRISASDSFFDGAVQVNRINASHTDDFYGHGVDRTSGQIELLIPGELSQQMQLLHDFLSMAGMSCKYDLNAIAGKVGAAKTIVDEFLHYYTWNGCNVDYSGLTQAAAKEKVALDAMDILYQQVKDAKSVTRTDKGLSFDGMDFAAITALDCGSVTFEDGVIKVDGMSVSIDDLSLLDSGEQYTVCLALARLTGTGAQLATPGYTYGAVSLHSAMALDDLNEADYDNAVIMAAQGSKLTPFNGGNTFTLSQSASFTLPNCTEVGSYTVVAYIATADGIRISQMLPIAFSSDVSRQVTGDGLKTQLYLNDGRELMADCTVDVDIYLIPEGTDLTYAQAQQQLLNAALNHGLPADGAALEIYDPDTNTAQSAPTDGNAGKCILRLAYIRLVDGQELPGYIYLDLTA